MSFYFAHPAEPNLKQAISPSVKEKGLSFFKAKPCDVQVTVLTSSVQPGFMCYLKSLPAFIEATLTQTRVYISNKGYPLHPVPHLIPLELPPLIYDFKNPPRQELTNTLLTHSHLVDGKGKDKSFVMQEPTRERIIDHMALYKEIINQKTAHIIGTVNLDAMKMLLILQKLFSAFLLTHAYPAFRHTTDVAPNPHASDIPVVLKKRKITNSSYEACMSSIETEIEDPGDFEKEATADDPNTTSYTNIKLYYAKPTPIQDDKWGHMDSIPNASGLYVPFVKDLSVADTITVPKLITDIFVRSLASTEDGMFAKADELRSAWGVICSTGAGHVLSHLGKCIDIALQGQAAVYPVFHGNVYEGCVIYGTGYSVSVRKVSVKPLAYAELQKLVSDSSSHSRALTEIATVVNNANHAIMECTSMRQLSTILKGIELDEISRQSIVRSAYHLSFNSKYWSTSNAHIKAMLGFLNDPDKPISDDVPMHPKYLFSSDRMELVLCAFGHQAPTFMIPNGAKYDTKNETPPKNFHVRTTTVQTAILDMTYVIENGTITNNIISLSGKHRDQSLNGSDKVEIWKALKQLVGAGKDDSKAAVVKVETTTGGVSIDDDLW